ncbi:MAG TPA: Wzz/FepE/Etk N-terminal domain-containing protein [Actinophytocola sp.]|uniref:Wzz/FepE/Etk N-terminal domain-containing protein n=1 Tax=Actinophytocola sp. TaxID=1872138 RepID=UPI002DBE38D3|nr:Wzz/FepE/Etk N-terminal domain-containing protein [Actinophytocola sp.]HEU5469751.1 Wzz/FepE/Etk N-terminal domain-containing protein [Actinophytocola sp.]
MTGPNAEPLLDLQRLGTAIRRRRRLWLSFGLVAMIAGIALAILLPPKPTAVALLLVVHEGDQASDSGSLVKTDVAVLQTTRIAKATLDKLGVTGERPEEFLTRYESVGLTNNIIQLTVGASTEDEAVRRAQALSEVFIADHLARIREAVDAETTALDERRAQAEAELAEVDRNIAGTPTTGNQSNSKLEELFARRSDLAGQISDLTQRAKETGSNLPRITAGTRIVDAPHPVPASFKMTLALNAGGGLLIGLAFGLTFAAVSGVVRDRPVLRREVAAHLGASVIAQLPAPHRGPARLWRRSKAVAERKRVAATLARAVRGETRMVSVLELGCPGTAAALTMEMAGVLADDGPVVIVNDLPGQDLAALTPETENEIRILDGTALPLPAWPREHHLGLGSVAPGTPWTDVGALGAETVLVVRAGHASTLWLHTVARQLADLRVPVIGVVLIDADRKDRSDGTLWDGLHTALRGRTAAAPAVSANGHGSTRKATPKTTADLPTERFTPVAPVRPAGTER